MNDLAKSVKHVMTIFLFCFIALISYIAYFQLFKSPEINAMPNNTIELAKKNEILRGSIYDSLGNILASSERVDNVTQQRNYPYSELYSHPIGYFSTQYGVDGLEAELNDELSSYNVFGNNFRQFIDSIDIKQLVENIKNDKTTTGSFNLAENFKTFKDNIKVNGLFDDSKKGGNGVITTLNTELQQLAYDALGDNKGSVVAINPKTGEILAMVSKPSYNPNDLEVAITNANSGSPEDTPLINRAIDGLYPPGSVFKTVTLSSALENIPEVTTRIFNDQGKIEFPDGTSLNNFAFQAHGDIDLRYAYRVSSNVVFGTLAMELGNEKLKATAEDYGFNSVIKGQGVTVTASQFPTLNSSEIGNIAQSGIGQGSVLATPMQMALVAATVGNDGVLMEPKLVSSIIDNEQKIVETFDNKEIRQVISKENAQTIQSYMKYLVDNNIYRWPAFDGTNAGGKTGTADYKLPDGSDAVPHGWFISVAPMDNPQIAVAVIVENGESGAGSAAIIASKVVRKAVLGY